MVNPDEVLLGTIEELVSQLIQDGIDHRREGERVLIPVERGPLDSTLVLMWSSTHGLVQYIVPLPFEVPAERAPTFALGLCHVNHALMLPGFGIDAEHRYPYFRMSHPLRPDGTIALGELRRGFSTAVRTAADLLPALAALSDGAIGPTEVLKTARGSA